MGGRRIAIGSRTRYLGVELDQRGNFGHHFRALAPRLDGAARALCGLLPNNGGPHDNPKRLYASVLSSMALYRAPEWAVPVASNRIARSVLDSASRRIDLRITRAYRTVSTVAASILAGAPLLDLLATQRKRACQDLRVRDRLTGRMRTAAED